MVGDRADAMLEVMDEARHDGVYRRIEVITGRRQRRNWTDEEKAAEALRPIAGEVTFAVFAAGIIGTGMLAVPVLAGSAAYAVAEMFRWPEGLDRRPREAKAFYTTITEEGRRESPRSTGQRSSMAYLRSH